MATGVATGVNMGVAMGVAMGDNFGEKVHLKGVFSYLVVRYVQCDTCYYQ